MAYKISGTVLQIGDTVTLPSRSGTPFTKRDLVITVRKFDQYTGVPTDDPGNTPKFSFMNSNCQQLDNVKAGDIVTVYFDINGRSYDKDGRTEYFTDLRPFRVEVQRQQWQQPQETQQQPWYGPTAQQSATVGMPPAPQEAPVQGQSDDLPF